MTTRTTRTRTSAITTEAIAEAILSSAAYSSFRRGYDNAVRNLDEEALLNELLSMHAKRRVRKMTATSIMADVQFQLSEASAQNQAFRSRATSIYVRLFMAHGDIADLNDSLWRVVSTAFGQRMTAAGLRSQAAKQDFYASLIPEVYDTMNYINRVMVVCNTIIADMDSARFTLTQQTQVFVTTARDR